MGKAKTDSVTRAVLAAELGCAMSARSPKWELEGMPCATRGKGGRANRYDVAGCRAWQQARDEAAAAAGGLDVHQMRAGRELAQALLAEQMHDQRSRRLVPQEEVDRVWSAEVAAVRPRLLNVPGAWGDRVGRAYESRSACGAQRGDVMKR